MNKCPKCGVEVLDDALFCLNCGYKLNDKEVVYNTQNRQKVIKLLITFVCFAIIFTTCFIVFNNSKKANKKIESRTIMLYVVGSNLESKSGILTSDLASLDSADIDLTKINILLYTGGTTEWNNEYIKNDQNGLYIYTENGFELIEAQKQLNMGSASTLSSFLNYSYENYPADAYDLVFWDHGGALDGALYDDFTKDNLSLYDMKKALEGSPFNKDNKLQTMLFRTCLNATIEVASIYKDYANYLIASEETSYGMSNSSVLNFFNEIKINDNGKDYGIKFVNAYKSQMNLIDSNNTLTHTYSVIDLSKIDGVLDLLDEYISGIDLDANYRDIVKARAGLYQYASSSPSYDTVDLYQLIESTKEYSKVSADKLLKALDEAILSNYNNDDYSKGLSIYFPYNGTTINKQKYLSVYKQIGLETEYYNFITTFFEKQKNPSGFIFGLNDNNEVDVSNSKESFSITLSSEQVMNYAYSYFLLFERNLKHPNYYYLILNSDRTTLKGNTLTANYKNDLIQVVDSKTNEKYFLFNSLTVKGKNLRYTYAILYDKTKGIDQFDLFMIRGDIYFSNKNGKPVITSGILESNDERISGSLIDLSVYKTAEIYRYDYKMLDSNGKVINDTSEWELSPVRTGMSMNLDEEEFYFSNLEGEGEYYGIMIVKDIYGDYSFSNLIRLGN